MEENNTQLSVIGFNHKSASLAERELLQITRQEIPNSLKNIFSLKGVEGIAIVNTCNRVEFYLIHNKSQNPVEIIKTYYSGFKNIFLENFNDIIFNFEHEQAVRHLFKVICGIDSLVLGEYQIQGQVKESYSKACEVKSLEKVLHKLFHAAFRVGKRVRSETSFGSGRQSVSGAAAQIMIDKLGHNDNIVIIGVNENTKILSSELVHSGFDNLTFLNRTIYKAEMLAEEYGGRAAGLDNLEKSLFSSKAVFTCTGAPSHIISKELLRKLYVEERYPKLIIDMAVPRDVESYQLTKSIEYYDLANLQQYLENQKMNQLEALPAAEKIIDDEVKLFQAWSETLSNELLQPYAEKFEALRQQILQENRVNFSEQSYEKVDKLTRSFLHRLQSTFVRMIVKQNGN